jgi:hypothetical protein
MDSTKQGATGRSDVAATMAKALFSDLATGPGEHVDIDDTDTD